MHDELNAMHERLLRHGVHPRWARRYRDELRDHLADLADVLIAEGYEPDLARQLARQRLGSIDMLEAAVTADRRALSLAARAPVLAYVAMPLLALVGTIVAIAAILVALAPQDGALAWLPALGEWAGPAAIAWAIAMFALGRRARSDWPLGGMVATLVLGAVIDLNLTFPSADDAGAVAVAISGLDTRMLLVTGLATLPAFFLLQSRLKAS